MPSEAIRTVQKRTQRPEGGRSGVAVRKLDGMRYSWQAGSAGKNANDLWRESS